MKLVWLFTIGLFLQLEVLSQNCRLSCPSNIIIKADSSKQGAIVNFPEAGAAGECGILTYTPASGSYFKIGSQSVTVTSASGQKCSFTVTVTDNEAPALSPVTLSTRKLWPPTNKMKKVAVYYKSVDNTDVVNTTLTVTSNAIGEAKDWEVINPHLVRLRAARLSNGAPRIYTITVISTDLSGNSTRRATSITVSNQISVEPVVTNNTGNSLESK